MATLTPAYGRDYNNKAAVESDFRAGKEFILNDPVSRWDGKLCSIRDFKIGEDVKLRYKKETEAVIITV